MFTAEEEARIWLLLSSSDLRLMRLEEKIKSLEKERKKDADRSARTATTSPD